MQITLIHNILLIAFVLALYFAAIYIDKPKKLEEMSEKELEKERAELARMNLMFPIQFMVCLSWLKIVPDLSVFTVFCLVAVVGFWIGGFVTQRKIKKMLNSAKKKEN